MLNIVAIKTAYLYSRNYYWILLLLLPLMLLGACHWKSKKDPQNNSTDLLN